ncbi:MAG: hypothetical protein ACO20F_11785 [Robiginitalea sp.]
MEAFYNDRVYYNLALDDTGDLLVSSNEGVFQVTGSILKKVNGDRGYISLRNGRLLHSKFTEEEMHSRYNHLLPDYYKSFNHYSREKGTHIYLISNNSLFIFKVSDYKTYLPKSSVRAFSANSIGTYDGIFCYGKKIRIPDYTSGHILERDSTFYICYDGLAIYKPNDSIQLFKRDLTGEAKFGDNSVGFARDIFKLNDGRFLLATTKGLYILSSTFRSVEKILEETSKNGAEIIHVDQQSETLVVTFSVDNSLYEYSLLDGELISPAQFEKSIEDGFKTEDTNLKKYVLLTDSELFVVTDSSKERVASNEFSDAYSLITYDKDKVLITTIDGAIALDLITKKATKIFNGIEFNKRALLKTADSIKLGTSNGYFSLSVDQLKNIIQEVDSLNDAERKDTLFTTIIAVLTIVSLLSVAFYLISLKRKHPDTNKIALHEVEAFIASNLNQVTIDSITNHFNLSLKELYELTYPNKPGKLITKKRKDIVKTLLKQDKDLVYISEITGFSVSYLKKIKSSLN